MKKNNFLDYISNVLSTKDTVYYDENDQYFYFYHDYFMFKLTSNASSAAFVIEEGDSTKKNIQSISLTYEETVNLIEKIQPLLISNNDYYQAKRDALGEGVFDGYIELLHEYLKNYNPVEDIANYSKANGLEGYVVHFPLDGINHICRIGRTGNYNRKKEQLLTSLVKIPFFFLENNTPKSPCIPYEIILPAWKIKDYPILENFVEPKLFGDDFSFVFENMIRNLPHGKELFKNILDSHLPEQNKKTKPNKI